MADRADPAEVDQEDDPGDVAGDDAEEGERTLTSADGNDQIMYFHVLQRGFESIPLTGTSMGDKTRVWQELTEERIHARNDKWGDDDDTACQNTLRVADLLWRALGRKLHRRAAT